MFIEQNLLNVHQNEVQIMFSLNLSSKFTLHQVDCDLDPEVEYCRYNLPYIAIFNSTVELLSYDPEGTTSLSDMFDEAIYLTEPSAPPRECCNVLNIERAGKLFKNYFLKISHG